MTLQGDLQFSLTIKYDDFIMRDHRVHQTRIMPGVTFLDMLLRYLRSKGANVAEIAVRRILFLEPIAVTQAYDQKVRISFKDQGGSYKVTAHSMQIRDGKPLADSWSENMRCEIHFVAPIERVQRKLAELTIGRKLDLDEVYSVARSVEIHHYEFMKGLGEVFHHENHLLAHMHLSDLAQNYLPHFFCHPAYLDAATCVFLLFRDPDLARRFPYIPLFIEEFRAFSSPGRSIHVYIPKSAASLSSPDLMSGDIEILDQNGNLQARFTGLNYKRIRSAELITRLQTIKGSPTLATPTVPTPQKAEPTSTMGSTRGLILEQVKALVSGLLDGRAPAPDAPFYDQGLTSTDLLDLVQNLERLIGEALYPTLLFEYTTINELVDYLETEHGSRFGSNQQPAPVAGTTPATSTGNWHQVLAEMIRPMREGEPGALAYDTPFYEQGLTSTDLLELVRTLETLVKQELYPTLLFEYTSIDALAQWLQTEYGAPQKAPDGEISHSVQQPAAKVYFSSSLSPAPLAPVSSSVQVLEIGGAEPVLSGSVHIGKGSSFSQINKNNFKIRLHARADYQQVLEQAPPFQYIVYHMPENPGPVADQIRTSYQAMLALTQALMGRKQSGPTGLLFVYKQNNPIAAGMSGFIRTLRRENPRFRYRMSAFTTALTPQQLTTELLSGSDEELEVVWRDGSRSVRNFTLHQPTKTANLPFKQGGVYLITGGAGGLGLIVAEFLAKTIKAQVVLCGRSPLDGQRRKQLNSIPGAVYHQTDINDSFQVTGLLDRIRQEFKAINGIIHSAGILRDAFIVTKNPADAELVMAPKIQGTLLLDQETAGDALDFFVTFSSTAAILGIPGQSDYAFANAFLDAWSAEREEKRKRGQRSGRTLSINWPLWKNGGMQVDAATEARFEREYGIRSLETEDGLETISLGLVSDLSHIGILCGDQSRISEVLGIGQKPAVVPAKVSTTKITASIPAANQEIKDIAIIGLSGRYPMAPDLESFWSNLVEGRDCISEIPRERWDYRPLFGPGEEGKTYARWGGFLDEIDRFDPLFFNITPREARLLDPQERLFLQTVHHTLEDAGLAQQRGSATGVFVGVMWSQYQILGAEESLWGVPVATNFSNASIANRVSYNYDFRGPCMAIDTMCSSSLVALSLACDALVKGDCEMAIAGGVNLSLHPSKYTYLTNFRMLSSDGRCRSFGEGGDGYVPGEGVGALLLKPLDQAIADGNRIYAVVKGSAINHGGRSGGFTVPNPRAQGELIAEGLRKTGIDPRTLSYIETHGTGTSLGDPIEISGLQRAFAPFKPESGTIPIGSVKSNIGHLEAAAGIAGITKILLQMQKGQLVPSLHSQPANSKIDFSRSPFRVQRSLETWKTSTHHPRRRAAISSFGAGGTNAFVILEEFPQSQPDSQSSDEQLFVLSARDPQRLQAYARSLCSFLASGSGTSTRVEDRIPVLCALTAAVLKVEDISAIDPDNEFSDYGMDPLHINELARRIEERWQAGLNPSDLLTCGTLTRIAARLPLEKEKGHNLVDLAWTSRCGRAAMEHRLAVVTSSTSRLQESLQAWLTGAQPAGLYTGEATESRTFSPDSDLHATARQWVSGGNCQWQDFGPRGQIVSMPGYPFANERYWISDREPGVVPEGFGHNSALHPLLGLNTSDFDLLRFTTHLTGKELFLDQHRLGETRLLPGVAILEMAREAVERASGRKVTGLRDVLWSAPIFIGTQAIDLHIALFPNEEGNSADFEVFSSENLRYSSGTVVLGSAPVQTAPFHEIDGTELDSQTVYLDLAATGLNYGPAFQTIQKLVCNMHEASSRVSLSEACRADFGRYVLHPCLTDGALQSVMGLLPDPGDRVFLPIAVGSVDLLGQMSPQGFVSVRLAGGTGDTRLFHITLYNDQQQAAVAIHNFAVRAADPLKMPNGQTMDRTSHREGFAFEVPVEEAITVEVGQTPDDGIERLFFVPTLKEITREKTFVPPAGPLLLFIEKDALKAEILNLLGDQTPTLLTVRPSGKFAENHGRFTMDPANPDHYVQLFERLNELNLVPTAAIHLWSRKQFSSDIGPIQAQIRKSLFSLFLLSQTMLQRRTLFPILFVSFYAERNPLYSAINAQIKSMAFEEPGLEISHLSFEGQPNEDLELAEILLRESGQKQRQRALLYRDGTFYAQAFAEIAQPAQTAKPDSGGVYLITGGMGGLGYLFARHLAEQGKVKLVLSGRSPLDKVRKKKLAQLKALNCEAIYISGDIADKKHVQELTETARKEFGHIDGVFHAAGVLRDARIGNKTLEQWTDVLGPKVLGTIFLDEATKDDDLGYFICFSSGSAVTGNIGQVDYATGNGFMDAWCSRRQEMTAAGKRKGIALSVNWPLWEDGGMDVDERGKQYLRKTFGLVPLTTESGLKAFYQALTPGGHVVFSEGDGNQIRDIMGVPAPQPKTSQARPEKTSLSGSVKTRPTATRPEPAVKEQRIQAPLAGTSASAREEALKLLRSMISKISEVPITRIGAEVPLEDFGIDSIMIMDLTAALETRFGKLPKTLFFEYQTAGQLADYFLSHFGQSFQSAQASQENTLEPTAQKDLASLPASSPASESPKRSLRRLMTPASSGFSEHPKAHMPIAIVGLSGRYPMAPDLDSFWQNLAAGMDCIEEIPAERWFHDRYYDPERDKPGKTYAKWGGFLKDIDAFDPLFFNIAPAEAELMDPQERLFLQTAWSAMEDAGYTREQLSRDPVGVFVGVMWGQYQLLYREDGENSVAPTSSYASIANRVSYWLNLSGPSMAVDTMCSSSLTALHLACRSLRDGECETAIAGGVNLMTHPQKYIQLARDSFAASDGRCRAFGEGGDGYVPGEGVGAVLLKPLEKALKDGDHVYGVIRATAINHGGKTNGYTVPNPRAQGAVISRALEESGIHPDSISYVEAHGTGTSLGDPIEINGLQRAWGQKTDRTQFCAIGSVKSNIGHLESAAGIAGLTKVLLQMKHGKLLPSIHSEKLNPNIDFHASPFVVQRKLADWVCVGLRRAALSSFGAGGANAHVILEEYRQEPLAHANAEPLLFVLSARTESRLRAQARNLLAFLKKNQPNLLDAAYTLHLCREAMDERLAIVAADHESLVAGLDNWLRGEQSESVHRGHNLVHADSAMLSEDEEGREFIRALIRSRKMNKVARLWVSGVDFDWQTLYPETCHRTSLPTYPFEQGRFWVTQQDGLLFFPTVNQGQVDVLHPLLHTNISTLREQKYATRLDGTRFFLAEHRVDGRKILPGACIIELARMAGCLAADGEVTAVADLLWAAPIVVNGAITEIHTVLYPERGGRIAFEIRSNDERPIIHAEGELQLNTSQESEMPSLDFSSILARCQREVDEEQTYNWFWEAGFDYGPSFTTIREMRLGQEEALVKLELPPVRSQDKRFGWHPSLIDGALQSVLGLVRAQDPDNLYLPHGIGEIAVFRPLPAILYVHVTRAPGRRDDALSYDLQLAGEDGMLVGRLLRFDLRMRAQAATGKKVSDAETLFFRPLWERSPYLGGETMEGNILVFAERGSNWPAMVQARCSDCRCMVVFPGSEFSELSEGGFVIDPKDSNHYQKLFTVLQRRGALPDAIIHSWANGDLEPYEQLNRGFYSLFYIARTHFQIAASQNLRLLILHESDPVQPYFAGLGGMARTITRENSAVKAQVIGFTELDRQSLVNRVMEELGRDASGREELLWDTTSENLRVLRESEEENYDKPRLRQGGVYLITGGLGGLGLIFAEYLSQQANGHLVLMGRRQADKAVRAQIDRLENLGARVLYITCDIADEKAVFEAVQRIRAVAGPINGVIHSAGVTRDSLILKKKEQDIKTVLAPKVAGTVNLDLALADEPLDFFVCFSSTVSLVGNAGQCDYAFGNGFMDSFASLREARREAGQCRGRTISINWPLWAEGGMQVDSETEAWMRDTLGTVPLETEAGIAAFERCLGQEGSGMMVVAGFAKTLRKALGLEAGGSVPDQLKEVDLDDRTRERLADHTRIYLTRLAATEIKIPSSEIMPGEPLENYGLESTLILRLTRRLEKDFGELSKTLFFEYQTIDQLVGYFMTHHGPALIDKLDLSQPEPVPAAEPGKEEVRFSAPEPRARFIGSQNDGNYSNEPIAVIGLAGRYPQARNIREFWANLEAGRDCVTEIPRDRWDHRPYFDPDRQERWKTYSKWGGFLDEVDRFDPLFFNISPREAELMDPQERLFLEIIWQTMEDAGYTQERLSGGSVGVFAGIMWSHYQLFGAEALQQGRGYAGHSSFASIANRISYTFNFHGPSIALDTMCSSSLTSVHLACESIRRGECETAFAGGVNLSLHPNKYLQLAAANFLASDGRCRAFGQGGDGYVPGEGVGAVLLKPLSKAIQDADNIYGLIQAGTVNHGGKTNGYTVPNPIAQGQLIGRALDLAGWAPETVGYIEAHGTGTSLGDPIEITGLRKAFNGVSPQTCAIGSVKSNVGHLESAAGICGLTKVLLQLHHRKLVPSLHSDPANPNIDFSASPFRVQRELAWWPQPECDEQGRPQPRRAGISAFGAGGSNAHLLLEEYIPAMDVQAQPEIQLRANVETLILLSARTPERLRAYAGLLLDWIIKKRKSSKTPMAVPDVDKGELRASMARELGVDSNEIDPAETFSEYGADARVLGDFTAFINDRFQLDLSPSFTSEYATINAVVEFLENYLTPKAVEEPEETINLQDLAYTLMTGRTAMQERMAMVIRNVEELMDRLSQFVTGKADIERLYQGNANSSKTGFLMLGKDGEAFINAIINNRQLDKCAQLWVSSVSLEWERFFDGEQKPRRISLPGYPFARTSYWVPSTEAYATGLPQPVTLPDQTSGANQAVRLLEKSWREQPVVASRQTSGGNLILAGEKTSALAEMLRKHLKGRVLVVQSGKEISGGASGYHCDFSDGEQGRQLSIRILNEMPDLNTLIDLSDLFPGREETKTLEQGRWPAGKVTLLQNLVRDKAASGMRVLHITHALQTFRSAMSHLDGALFAGFVKMLGAEHRRIRSSTVDLDLLADQISEVHPYLLAELSADDQFSEICYRQGRRFVPVLLPCHMPTHHKAARGPLSLDPEKVVVISGGTSGIGAAVAKNLIDNGASKLVLMGYQAMPPRSSWNALLREGTDQVAIEKIKRIRVLEERGAQIMVYIGPLTEEAELDKFFQEVRRDMGPIGGVIHCAGLATGEPAFVKKDMDSMEKVFEPKVFGLMTLDRLLGKDPLDFFLLFSSVSSLMPTLATGVSDYAAANGFMDYYADYQHTRGRTFFRTIHWPNWKEVGMGEVKSPVYDRLGLMSLPTSTGLYLMRQVLDLEHQSQVMPALVDPARFEIDECLLVQLPQRPGPVVTVVADSVPLETTSNSNLIQFSLSGLRRLFSEELRIPLADLNDGTPFADYGVDSILLADLVRKMEKWLGTHLEPGILLENPTLAELSNYLVQNQTPGLSKLMASDQQGPERTLKQPAPAPEAFRPLASPQPPPVIRQIPAAAPRSKNTSGNSNEPIAVIGIGCHFPDAPDQQTFWKNLAAGRFSVREVPSQRWDINKIYRPEYAPGKSISKWGSFIEGIENFDPEYFGINPEEAIALDPLVRQILETSVQALRHAGYQDKEVNGSNAGVFIGSRMTDYTDRLPQLNKNCIAGMGQNFIAAHLSHFLNLKGPNLVLDSACSSSLLALHLACQSLRSGESELAFAGGVDLILDEKPYIALSESRALSPDGKCHTFDEKANGFVPGEGCGIVILKTLSKAIADGDAIYAVISGTAVNNDGRTMGITTPNPEMQKGVIRDALRHAGLSAHEITLIENHGTGTMIGDPIELKALTQVFREFTTANGFCGVGSIKTNLGHLLSAAGMAGFIKMALAVYHGQMPPTLHCETPNPRFDFHSSPFFPVQELSPWQPEVGVRRGGISAFGFGGTNAHVIVSEAPLPPNYVPQRKPLPLQIFNRRRLWLEKPENGTGWSQGGNALQTENKQPVPLKANLFEDLEFEGQDNQNNTIFADLEFL